MKLQILLVLTACLFKKAVPELSAIYAVNCGGEAHLDVNGIQYRADKNKVGTASDFGRMLAIARVNPQDMILYQTERYHFKTFSYDVSLKQEGDYVLVLQFSEVYFSSAGQKVFSVELNGETVVRDLDIFERVGKGVAHNEHITFNIRNRQLHIGDQSTAFDGKLTVSFVKGYKDNPKVNAFYIIRGSVAEVPKLPEVSREEAEEEQEEEEEEQVASKPSAKKTSTFKKTSGPAQVNPYASDESYLMPIMIAIAVFIPTVFCLCRL